MRSMTGRRAAAIVALAVVLAACSGSEEGFQATTAPEALTRRPTTTAAGQHLTGAKYYAGPDEGFNAIGGTDTVNDEPYDLTFFDNYGVNPRVDTEDDALSTFAVDVDTGSYTVGRRWLTDGYVPDKDSVRVEEYVNFFDYGYEAPDEEAFAIHLEGGPTPFAENDRYQLLQIGIQSLEIADEDRKPANLTFVIDVSGSMDREDRLETVKESLALLVNELRPSDQVGIVIYGSRGEVLLDPTAVEEERDILRAIERLRPGGSTNAEEGLVIGYRLAREAFTPGAINRVILCSDGVANVGNTGADSILAEIEEAAGDGIQLVTVGFGMGNYNDVLMEQLADGGDGFYAYVDDLKEAERLFVHDLTGTLQTVALDTKVQVAFNEDAVERWRLVGFENRAIEDDEFRDDSVDAGEIGAGHSVTALYEIRLADGVESDAELATVSLRWRDPDSRDVHELSRSIRASALAGSYGEASDAFHLAATVAAYAEMLRESYWAQHLDWPDLEDEAHSLLDGFVHDDVTEFVHLVEIAAQLAG